MRLWTYLNENELKLLNETGCLSSDTCIQLFYDKESATDNSNGCKLLCSVDSDNLTQKRIKRTDDFIEYYGVIPQDYLVLTEVKKEIVTEMAYPANFDLFTLASLPTFKKRKEYCDERLVQLGKGSSRIAYKVDDEKVLKLAFNHKGVAQNRHEANWMRNNYEVFARIFEADMDNYTWIEMELARPATQADVKRIWGITWTEAQDLIKYCYEQFSKRHNRTQMYYSTMVEKLYDKFVIHEVSDFFVSFQRYIYDYQPYTVSDWLRLNNWGVVTKNGKDELVIIDDGLDEEIWKTHYLRGK
jgi:hypothetical protein